MRIFSFFGILLALTVGGYSAVEDAKLRSEADRIRASLNRLTSILSRLAPLEANPSLVAAPPTFIGVNYCWRFQAGSPDLYDQVARIVLEFHGNAEWNFNWQFNQKGACIATVVNSTGFYTPIPDAEVSDARTHDAKMRHFSLLDEIDKLCDFMDAELPSNNQREQLNEQSSPSESQEDVSIYEVILVRDVKHFHRSKATSEEDVQLNFGLAYDEWHSLFFEVLGKGTTQTGVHPIEFQGGIDGYPLLSRLNDIHDDAAIESSEVKNLKNECIKAEARARDNTTAQKCIEKLLLTCRKAEELKTGIYFAGN